MLFNLTRRKISMKAFPPVLIIGFGSDERSKKFVAEFGNRWDSDEELGVFILFSEFRNIVVTMKIDDQSKIQLHGCSLMEFNMHYEAMDRLRLPDVEFDRGEKFQDWSVILDKIKNLSLYEGDHV